MRLNQSAGIVEHANDRNMRTTVKLCIANRIISLAVPKLPEWQCFTDQIEAPLISTRSNLINVGGWQHREHSCVKKWSAPVDSFYRSLRAVKVLLAALRSTLTVLAPREEVGIGSR